MRSGDLVEIDGFLIRRPGLSYHEIYMPYYEPVMSYIPLHEETLVKLYEKLTSQGLIVRVDLPADSKLGNHQFDYHEIDISLWPKTLHTSSRYGNQFRKLCREVTEFGTFSVEKISPLEYEKDNLDMESDLALISWNFSSTYVKISAGRKYAYFRLVESTYKNEKLVYSIGFKSHGLFASVATWFLCKHLSSKDVKYFDMWNLTLSEREVYKKLFFTAETKRQCLFNGEAPEWMEKL